MSTLLCYFTGSGNSYYIAKELAKQIPDVKLLPIVSLLDKESILLEAEKIGFVFPVHGMTLPVPVSLFFRKAKFQCSYYFAVTTRGGTKNFGFRIIDRYLKKQGTGNFLNAFFSINFFNNDPKLAGFNVPALADFQAKEAEIEPILTHIARTVIECQNSREKDTAILYPSGIVIDTLVLCAMRYALNKGIKKYFYANESCKSCGICERVCPAKKIVMRNEKPEWLDTVRCFCCYACVNYCKEQAVQIKDKWFMKSHTKENGRYPHPYASAKEIEAQKFS